MQTCVKLVLRNTAAIFFKFVPAALRHDGALGEVLEVDARRR